MKGLFIAHNVRNSGANKSFMSVIEQLKNKISITVLVNAKDGSLVSALNAMGVQTCYCRYSWWDAHYRKDMVKRIPQYLVDKFAYDTSYCSAQLIQKLKKENYDFVYSNTSTIDIGARIAEKLGLPHIWHIREFGKEDFGFIPLTSSQYRAKRFNDAKCLIVISHALKEKYRHIVPEDKIKVVYNGFEIKKLTHAKWAHHLDQRINVVVTGQVTPAKGQKTAIEAVAALVQKGYPIKLHIAGAIDHSYIDPVLKRFPGAKDWCTLHGPVSDMFALRKEMDVELVCSRSEAFGRVTLEAMLHSLPVIGSASGGTPELIEDGKTGLLFQAGNAEQLAACIEKLINDQARYDRIIENARAFAEQFTIEATAQGVYDCIVKVVNNGKE